ncbi:Uncharacterised protein [Mycobacteroides abscessus subsp. massiliense]|nr:Uncharacterised protein [Mycobacteroides abscessus subsp. massiliense]
MVETSPISPSRLSEAVNTNYPSFENNPFSANLISNAMDMAGTVGNGQFKEGQDPEASLSAPSLVRQPRHWDSSPAWPVRR